MHGGSMRFFTDDFFTEQQKSDLLGTAYASYAKEQQREKQLELDRQLRVSEMELHQLKQQQQRRATQKFARAGFAALAFIILLVTLSSGLGVLPANV